MSADLTKKEIDEELGRCAWDPLRFAIWAFPWGETPEFSLVKLPEKWRKRYPNCEYGPDAWLTVIPKDQHYQMLELPKSLETHQL